MQISGKVVLITGASEGIGAACAEAFRFRGARLALVARNESKLRAVAGLDALAVAGDLTDAQVREKVIARTLETYGRIDVLVNNAGIGLYGPASQVAIEAARALFELNFFVPLEMIQRVLPSMRQNHEGAIVNVSSIGGEMTLPWMPLYSASKYALGSLSDGLRVELKRDGIHVMTVCPGYVDTEFQQHAIGQAPGALQRRRPFSITARQCAEAIVRGLERNARKVVTPRAGWAAIWLNRIAPNFLEQRLVNMRGS